MKILIIMLSLLSFVACESEFQNNNLDLTKGVRTENNASGDGQLPDLGDVEPNDLTLIENMQNFLDTFVELKEGEAVDTLVNYEKLYRQQNNDNIKSLRATINNQLKNVDLDTLSRDEHVALLINAYNFFAIELINANLYNGENRLESILNIEKGFDLKIFNVGGIKRSLNQIEKKGPLLDGETVPAKSRLSIKELLTHSNGNVDARFHFAVICAANGCPILSKEAYTGEKLDQQLTDITIAGLNQERNLKVEGSQFHLTKLFDWYGADFKGHTETGSNPSGTFLNFLKQYVAVDGQFSGKFIDYDWRLNITKENKLEKVTLESNIQSFYDKYVVLKENSDVDTLVDYRQYYSDKKDGSIKQLRDAIINSYAEIDFSTMTKNEKIASLTNAYNFFAIDLVRKNLFKNGKRLKSITRIGLIPFSSFKKKQFILSGKKVSLDNIEKGGIKGFPSVKSLMSNEDGTIDARFHFSVICAALGCPILMKEAYTGENLDAQLDAATIAGLKQSRNLVEKNGSLYLTELFNWYQADFQNHRFTDGKAGTIQAFINGFLPQANTNLPVKFTKYDWKLNILE